MVYEYQDRVHKSVLNTECVYKYQQMTDTEHIKEMIPNQPNFVILFCRFSERFATVRDLNAECYERYASHSAATINKWLICKEIDMQNLYYDHIMLHPKSVLILTCLKSFVQSSFKFEI